jgi:23S rRNA pseudouridine1911/1915/1917 synthase
MPTWVVGSRDDGARLDAAIAAHLHISVAEARRLIADNLVRVGGRPAQKGNRVCMDDEIEVRAEIRPGERSYDHVPTPDHSLLLEVVYEDEALVAINKPAGIDCHPLRAKDRGTIAHALLARWPSCATASEDAREAGLVHRLDRGTTGVLIAAKHRAAWEAVRAAFGRQEVDKTYWALVEHWLEGPTVIDAPLHTRGGTARVDRVSPDALPALTRVRPLVSGRVCSLVEATTHTGRLHQIRAHLAHVGHPLVGDQQYGAGHFDGVPPDEAILHARAVSLPHPNDGWKLTIAAPLPVGRKALIERLLGAPIEATDP